jgi:hypothetical protein
LAAKMDVELDIRLKAESFSLLVSAIENADLAAVIPQLALQRQFEVLPFFELLKPAFAMG